MHWATVKIEGALNTVYHLFGRGCRLLILWIRLRRSVAGAEFARLSTGVRITRGNSGNGVLLTRENRAGREQKSRNGKGVRRGATNAFPIRLGV
jgi:hypothetical protein